MCELIQVSERRYYIQGPAKIVLLKLDKQNTCLINSSNDKDAGRKVRHILDTKVGGSPLSTTPTPMLTT